MAVHRIGHSLLLETVLSLHNTSGLHKISEGKKKNKKKFKFVSENLLLHSISQGQFMITPSQRSPSPPCDFPTSIKSSSHLHFCDFIQRHVRSCHRYHSKVFKINSQHLILSHSNHHHGWNTEFAQKGKDLVLPQFKKLKDNPQLFRILL